MSEAVPSPIERGKSRREARALKDRKTTELRKEHPFLAQMGDTLEWIGLGVVLIAGAKVFVTYFGMKVLIGNIVKTAFGVEFVGVVFGVPPPSQWPRMVRNLFRRNGREDIKVPGAD